MKIQDFQKKKAGGVRISMVTCYDSWSAALVSESNVDCVLVGDSIAMTLYGHNSTLPADIDLMAAHTAAVRRALPDKFIIGDMPFLSYRSGLTETMKNVGKLMRAGANAVKLEGAGGNIETVRHIIASGVPLMGHIGLTPQAVNALGGFRVQGRCDEEILRLLNDARDLEEAGAFSLVLEAVPEKAAQQISSSLRIPVIGIGAGAGTDGQVLVLQDLLGLTKGFKPKFVRNFLNGAELVINALNDYHREVLAGSFPASAEWY
ncbi:3-methyl-2-oxobutanoate hydroxymethyltransferase [Marispirochaeta sp.]|uniref:3-methyl-2-oxobutanoate hydroxymethyltransferase n=1 Tax=Marispirochaeta sp. TaxID=2038653 RepID=UPI0029C83277|nr:3-methyl-2-oxobutanoate hydroxymethyltransferase [Marispirochaeta sp.]